MVGDPKFSLTFSYFKLGDCKRRLVPHSCGRVHFCRLLLALSGKIPGLSSNNGLEKEPRNDTCRNSLLQVKAQLWVPTGVEEWPGSI